MDEGGSAGSAMQLNDINEIPSTSLRVTMARG
jgi:hypothetical protein